ncbi:MAG: hypothetical protein K5931_01615 [Lachnospiraceae bacterium]|nr:hypothetical protein [Lachnospiraceae bacterium]
MEGKKSNKLAVVIGVITLVILGYVLFITLYNQIIAQNEGFFYIFLFGGILVLVFVLLSLITKLIAISPTDDSGIVWNILESLALIVLSCLFFWIRFRYSTSLAADETLFYREAAFLADGTLTESLDVVNKLLRNPMDYAYGKLLGFIFMISGEDPEIVLYYNAVVIILTAFFAYRCARLIGGRLIGILAYIASLFIPSQSYGVYSYNSEYLFALFIFICLDIYLFLYLRDNLHMALRIVLDIVLGISLAFLLYIEPVALIFVLAMLFHSICFRRKESNNNILNYLLPVFVAAVMVFLLLLVKANTLGTDYGDTFMGISSRFNPSTNYETGMTYELKEIYDEFQKDVNDQTKNIVDNYYFLERNDGKTISAIEASWLSLGTNLFYMFVLVLSVGCVFFMLRVRDDKVIPILLCFLAGFFIVFLKATKDTNSFYFFEILIVIACCGLRYMYENHHPELSDKKAAQEENGEEAEPELTEEELELKLEEERIRAKALIFIGENDILYNQLKEEEHERVLALREKAKKEKEEEEKAQKGKKKGKKNKKIKNDSYSEENAGDEWENEGDDQIVKPKKGEPLENPLPVPKKHKSKPMEFDSDIKKGKDSKKKNKSKDSDKDYDPDEEFDDYESHDLEASLDDEEADEDYDDFDYWE